MIITAQDNKTYKEQIKKSLENDFLRKSLDNFATSYRASRENAFAGMDLESMRATVECSKAAALPRMDELYKEFKKNAEAAGVHVHLAKDADEANRIIASIAKENEVTTIVKSKSMTAEETFLNTHLEKERYHITETDLGEWIIQLRHEGPSHMVMPAIHLSRYQVGELFSEVSGEKKDPEDIAELVKVARKELRPKFIKADMGVSGANFAIADSGTIGLVTNEGNARLTSTLPAVHVALVGLDKLVPDLKTAMNILKILPKNATGQAITSYVTWIKGAVESGSSPENKKVKHIVFLDNGRKALAEDPVFGKALQCIRCGACANVCPVYRMVGGHTFGHVYIGAIGLILTLFYHGRENARAIVKSCLNCQSCKSVCPGNIDLPYLIKQVYAKVLEEEGGKPAKNKLLSMAMKNRKVFHFLMRRAYLAQKPMKKGQYLRHLPSFLAKDHNFKSLPAIAATPLRDEWSKISPVVTKPKYKIAFFAGCAVDFMYPQQGRALAEICQHFNVEVDFPMDQTCCGLPAMMMTETDTAKSVAHQNMAAFKAKDYDYIITLCASCGSHLKENLPKLLTVKGDVPAEVTDFTKKVIDFSSFMTDVLQVEPENFKKSGKKVTHHAPCHLVRGLEVKEAPYKLLEASGVDYVESADKDVCCGFSGSFSVDFPQISSALLTKKLDNAENTGAEILVTDCPGCIIQIRGGMEDRDNNVQVKHMAELIAEELK